MIVFGGADIGYAYRLASDEFVVRHLARRRLGARVVAHRRRGPSARASGPRGVPGARSLAVAGLASVVAVGVLVLAAPACSQAPPPSLLALLALGCCGLRSLLAFLPAARAGRRAELALTDELTGVGQPAGPVRRARPSASGRARRLRRRASRSR